MKTVNKVLVRLIPRNITKELEFPPGTEIANMKHQVYRAYGVGGYEIEVIGENGKEHYEIDANQLSRKTVPGRWTEALKKIDKMPTMKSDGTPRKKPNWVPRFNSNSFGVLCRVVRGESVTAWCHGEREKLLREGYINTTNTATVKGKEWVRKTLRKKFRFINPNWTDVWEIVK